MPAYDWLLTDRAQWEVVPSRVAVQRRLGVPYPVRSEEELLADMKVEADAIAADLTAAGAPVAPDRDIVALIAYLQRLGKSTAHLAPPNLQPPVAELSPAVPQ
jgi:cytochrome c oxidase cbb3-type subunit I/II